MQLFKTSFLLAIFSSFILVSSIALADTDSHSEAVKAASGGEIHQEATHANIHNKQEADALPKSPAEYIFHKMDTNRDSSLSLSEFVSNFSMINDKSLKNRKYSGESDDGQQQQGFWNGFSSSTMMIIATEIGDKTFFIAAVLSMRNSRLVVFAGAIGALICMTVLR